MKTRVVIESSDQRFLVKLWEFLNDSVVEKDSTVICLGEKVKEDEDNE